MPAKSAGMTGENAASLPHPLPSLRSAALLAVWRAAAAHLRLPGAVLALHDVESLDGVAVRVEGDRAAEPGEARKLGHVVADPGAVGFKVFRLPGDAGLLDRV